MSLTPEQAFCFGFLLRCADEGLSPAQTQARVKQAAAMTKQALNPLNATQQLLVAGLLGGAGLGAAGGWATAKLSEPNFSLADQQSRELTTAYKIQAERIRQARARRGFRQPRPEFMLSPR